jgi:D-galactarolactone isomerase
VPLAELKALDAAGMRGIRLNRLSQSHDVTVNDLEPMAKRLAPIGWHLQVQEDGASALDWLPRLRGLPVPVVIDHVAKLPKGMDLNDPRFIALLRLLEDGNVWVKLSAPYHGSAAGHPYTDMAPRIRALVEARPDRMLWALNWPHPPFAPDDKPEPAACLDVLLDAVPHAPTRQAILADNPARLYGF